MDGSLKLALAGDVMMGRGVAEVLAAPSAPPLWSPEVAEVMREGDLVVVNLECCISARGAPWPDPGKPFFFRAPPVAAEALARLGVSCVTLANNHALDFGRDALLDTFEHLAAVGIRWVGAGPDVARARAPMLLEVRGVRVAVVAATDHPSVYAAAPGTPGVAFADLRQGVPDWLHGALADAAAAADVVLLAPHWGPNNVLAPRPHVRAAAEALRESATLIAGHSAHVFHGIEGNVLYDLGGFVDDYSRTGVRDAPAFARALARTPGSLRQVKFLARRFVRGALRRARGAEPQRRDLGLLVLATLEPDRVARLEVVPLKLEYRHTRLAVGEDFAWASSRFRRACEALGTQVREESGRLVVDGSRSSPAPVDDPEAGRRNWSKT